MPPVASTTRKGSLTTSTARRTTRPANYYARPFGSLSGASANHANAADANDEPLGFFPAVQFFTDAVTALPKEVMRQFTLMKEVEAKVHGPNEKLGELVDAIMELPIPPRKATQNPAQQNGGLINLASNSALGSASASLINGVAPGQQSAQASMAGSVNGEDLPQQTENDEELARRKRYFEIRAHAHNMLPNLDEKNVVLAEANRVLGLQLARIDSVLPHIDNEISEDARLGSMTHWAYSDNRKKTTGGGAHSRAVQATNTLANVASAMHEADIAQMRREAGREAKQDKARGRAKEHIDSDFDDKPKKTNAKLAKGKVAALAGLGISTNGEPVKRRKVDKSAPAMERSASGPGKNSKSAKDPPRSTPNMEASKKTAAKGKPGPPKKKIGNSASNSPALVSSPLHNSFNPANIVEPPGNGNGRPQSSRVRQASTTTTNLRHEQLVDGEISRPDSVAGSANGAPVKNGTKRKAPSDGDENSSHAKSTTERDNKPENGINAEAERPGPPSRSASNSGRGGRGSKNGTPRAETFPETSMVRSRSVRGVQVNDGHESSSSEPQRPGTKHKRVASNSHLVKQLASFNRSPDLDRTDLSVDEDEIANAPEDVNMLQRERSEIRRTERRPVSRRDTNPPAESSPPPSEGAVEEDEDHIMVDTEPPLPELEHNDANDIDEDEESEHDPDDPNEDKYCYCNRGSFGEMVACDNDKCEREWFHLECTELQEAPGEEETWYCRNCRPQFARKRGGRGGRRGGG